MAAEVSGLHVFANDTGPESLALLDNNYSPLTTALNTLANFTNSYDDAGVANGVIINVPSPQICTAYTDGLGLWVKIAATNTGAATINVAAIGQVAIVNPDGTALAPGQLIAGGWALLAYDATRGDMQLLTQITGASGRAGGYLAPAALASGATNNYAPSGWGANVGRLDLAANAAGSQLTGLTATVDGHICYIRNLPGSGILTLESANAGSSAANQFSGGGNLLLPPGARATAIYYGQGLNYWSIA